MGWIDAHYLDVLLHLFLDLSGGITLRCAIGMCNHKTHQYLVWAIFAVLFSIMTVALIG